MTVEGVAIIALFIVVGVLQLGEDFPHLHHIINLIMLTLFGLIAVGLAIVNLDNLIESRRKMKRRDRREIQAALDADLDAVNDRTWLENGGKPGSN